MKQTTNKRPFLVVYETNRPGIFADHKGRCFDQAGLDAMAAHGIAILKSIAKTPVQSGDNRDLGGKTR